MYVSFAPHTAAEIEFGVQFWSSSQICVQRSVRGSGVDRRRTRSEIHTEIAEAVGLEMRMC